MKWFRIKWFLLFAVRKEFRELEVVASNCFTVKSQTCEYKALHELAPTDLSSPDPWIYLLSVSAYIPSPGPLFLPFSSNFPLLTPNASSLFQRGHRELLAQVSTPQFSVFNTSHTAHYLLMSVLRHVQLSRGMDCDYGFPAVSISHA